MTDDLRDDALPSSVASALPSLADEILRLAPAAAEAMLRRDGVIPSPAADAIDADDLAEFGPRLSLKEVRQLRALKAFAIGGHVGNACKAAGVKYSAWYRWIDEDPDFARALEQAKDMLADEIEGVAITRAKEGSDTLLLALLKALKPEKYREKQTITLVSPDVQSRLARQADVIVEVCRREIADATERARVIAALAGGLREVWS